MKVGSRLGELVPAVLDRDPGNQNRMVDEGPLAVAAGLAAMGLFGEGVGRCGKVEGRGTGDPVGMVAIDEGPGAGPDLRLVEQAVE